MMSPLLPLCFLKLNVNEFTNTQLFTEEIYVLKKCKESNHIQL